MEKPKTKDRKNPFLSGFYYETSGGIAVEFILILPLILFLIIAVADFGSHILKKQNLASVNRGIVTIVSNTPDFTVDQGRLINYARNALGPSAINLSLTVNKECRCASAITSCQINCAGQTSAMFIISNISYDYPLLFPYPGIEQNLRLSNILSFRVK